MCVVENTGEVTFCREVDVFDSYVMADMIFIPIGDVYDIIEMEEPI